MQIFLIDPKPQDRNDLIGLLGGRSGTEVFAFPDREALRRWLEEERESKRLRVQTFGNFEVFYDETPIHFRRSRTKELLAYLIDRRGAGSTMGELISVLWEGRPDTDNVRSQLRSLIADLRTTLRAIGQESLIIKRRDLIAVDPSRVECDYYRFLSGDKTAGNSFRGEYMSNYSWAETTVGALQQKK